MKKLKKIIKNSVAGLAVSSLSIFSGFSQNHLPRKDYFQNSVEISAGNQSWKDEGMKNIYGDIFIGKIGFSRKFSERSSLELSSEYGSMNVFELRNIIVDNIGIGNGLKYYSTNFGLRANAFSSEDGKTNAYLKGGIKRTFVSEEVDLTFEKYKNYNFHEKNGASAWGYYVGAGIETAIIKNLSGFIESEMNQGKVPLYEEELEVGGIRLTSGFRYNFNIYPTKESCPGPWK